MNEPTSETPNKGWPEPPLGMIRSGGMAVCYAGKWEGWIFVLHADGVNWTSAAKLTDATYRMLKGNMLMRGAERVMRDTAPELNANAK